MRTDTITIESAEAHLYRWRAGVAGGLVGGIGMGLILHAGANIMPFIGALYGWPTTAGGWVAHLVHSVLIGLVFALLVSRPVIREQMTTLSGSIAGGIVYAAAVGLVTSGVMLPIAMNMLGTRLLPEPLLPVPGVLGGLLVILSVGVAHLVYGILLGATYSRLHTAA
jgi:hypothetical protein